VLGGARLVDVTGAGGTVAVLLGSGAVVVVDKAAVGRGAAELLDGEDSSPTQPASANASTSMMIDQDLIAKNILPSGRTQSFRRRRAPYRRTFPPSSLLVLDSLRGEETGGTDGAWY
jgi:hypothetical protein